jgi:hypothetical protein
MELSDMLTSIGNLLIAAGVAILLMRLGGYFENM